MESPNLTIRPEDKTIESQAVQVQSEVMGGSPVEIKSCERIDDLQCKGYQIIQNSGMFCFGMDAVLLANYVRFKRGGRYLDLGTGTGIIPILLAAKEYGDEALTRAERLVGLDADDCRSSHDCIAVDGVTNSDAGVTQQSNGKLADGARFIGIELQPACADMAARSVSLNGLDGLVRIDNGDIKEVSCNYKKASFDIVTSNPPYIKGSHGLENPDAPKNIARHEVHVTLEQVVAAAEYALKPGGSFYMIHKPFRLAEIFECLHEHRLEPKRMQLVHPYIDKEPNMVIVEAVKGGNSMIKIDPPMIVYKAPGVYTEQLLATYEGSAKR